MSGRGRAPTVLSSLGRGRGRGRAVPAPRRPGTAERMQEHAPGPPLHVQPSPLLQGQHHQEGRAAMVSAGMNQTEGRAGRGIGRGHAVSAPRRPGTAEGMQEHAPGPPLHVQPGPLLQGQHHQEGRAAMVSAGMNQTEELSKIQQFGHRFRAQSFAVELMDPHSQLQLIPSEELHVEREAKNCATILVSGVPDSITWEHLEYFFQSPETGGCDDCVVECTKLSSGRARVTFCDPTVAAQVLSKSGSHSIDNCLLRVQYADEEYELNKLLLHFSQEKDHSLLVLYLQKMLKLKHPKDFSVEVTGLTAVITFSQEHSKEELMHFMEKISDKPPRDTTIKAELCQVLSVGCDSQSGITLRLSGLPQSTTTDVIEQHFESRYGDISATRAIMLGNGKATVTLSGLSREETQKLLKDTHKIKGKALTVELCASPNSPPDKPPHGPVSCSLGHSPTRHPKTVVVSGVPEHMDDKMLKMYFEGRKTGGSPGCVCECSVFSPGKARVKFHDSKVLESVISKSGTHSIEGSQLHVRVADESGSDTFELDKLLIQNIPNESVRYLSLHLENNLELSQPDDFTVEVKGTSAVILFSKDYSIRELHEMATKIRTAPHTDPIAGLAVELCQVNHTVRVSGITENYDERYLKMHFANPSRSGGGGVHSVELLGCGEAVITFKEYKAIPSVLKKNHGAFLGADVSVVKQAPFELQIPDHSLAMSYRTRSITVDPLTAKSLCKDMEGLQGCVEGLHVTVHIDHDTGTITGTPSQHTRAKWEEVYGESLNDYIDTNYAKETQQVPQGSLPEITALIRSIPESAKLALSLNDNKTFLSIAGEVQAVNVFSAKIGSICSKYIELVEHRVLTPQQYYFFTELKLSQVSSSYPSVTIIKTVSEYTVTFKGSVWDVTQLIAAFPQHLTMVPVPTTLDPLVVQFFETEIGKAQLHQFMQKRHFQAAPYFEHISQSQSILVFLCDPKQESATRDSAEVLRNETQALTHSLPQSFVQQMPQLKEYPQLCLELQQQHNVEIVTSNVNVSVAGFTRGVNVCLKALDTYIQEKCTTETRVEINSSTWRLFCGPMTHRWRDLMAEVHQSGIKVVLPAEKDDKPQVILSGDILSVQEGHKKITSLLQLVHENRKSFPLSRPGTCRFFQEEKVVVFGIERQHRVVIETEEIDDLTVEESVTTSVSFSKTCEARANGLEIALYIGDITEFRRAEVIVNAANGRLQHRGGVAKAIADKGGPIIQQDSLDRVRSGGELAVSQTWLSTKVGNLPFRAIIHAVGPKWSGGYLNERDLLQIACLQSLQTAASQQYRSIAFPAIGSGMYRFPKAQCAEALIKATVDFSKTESTVREVNFILRTPEDSAAFIAALKNHIPSATILEEATSAAAPHVVAQMPLPKPIPSYGLPSVKKHAASVTIQIPIKLHQGNLLDVQADVFVNTTNTRLDLSKGAVARVLAEAAGPELQSECTKKAPVAVGGVAVTSAGKLPCRYVLHTVAPSFDKHGGKAEEALKKIVWKCMQECIKLEATSIAFPALGTGNLHFPNDVVATIMIDQISEFWSSCRPTILKVVHLVIFMPETYQAFQNKLASLPMKKPEVQPLSLSPPIHQGKGSCRVPSCSPAMGTNGANKMSPPIHQGEGSCQVPSCSPAMGTNRAIKMFGSLSVQVVQGDISEEATDVVVNPTNEHMKLGTAGVSGALLRKGGTELQRECDRTIFTDGPLKEGKLAVTTSGLLKAKWVFHVLFESEDAQKLTKLTLSCLKKAEKRQCQSISFPAIGTGTKDYSPEVAAQAMFQAIKQFSSISKPTHLAHVRLVFIKPDVCHIFDTAMHSTSGSVSSLFGRFGGFIGSILPAWSSSTPPPDNIVSENKGDPSENDMHVISKEVKVTIYGETSKAVEDAEQALLTVIDDFFPNESVKFHNLGILSPEDIEELQRISRQKQVQMQVTSLDYVRIRGHRKDVSVLTRAIFEAISRGEQHASKLREAEILCQRIKWKRQDSQGSWIEYEPLPNFEIEQAYERKKTQVVYQGNLEHFSVDFNKMEETEYSSLVTCKVTRVDLFKEGDTRPAHWSSIPLDDTTKRERPMHLVKLNPDELEYKEVLKEFNKTMTPGQNYHVIVSIQRVQAPALYAQYTARKREMDRQNPKDHPNERRLFHGTSESATSKISLQGFNRSFAGLHAVAFGRGVYFARDASYSAKDLYSPLDSNGHKYVYYARVLTGVFTKGSKDMLTPPARNLQQDPNFLHDSVVNDPSTPSIFVIFSDAQAYPEHLISFK